MSIDDRLTTLDALWSVWAGTGKGLTEADWRRPTRLDGWDLRALWAHSAAWPFGFSILVGRVTDAPATHATAAALLGEFNVPDGIANTTRDRVADSGREDAEKYTVEQLVDQFATTGPHAIAQARQLGDVSIDYFGRAVLPLGEAVSIGILEATVHLLDVQRALGHEPDVPADGLAHTAEVIAHIAPPVDFIEAATGRASTDLFPVMS
ncbi:maleylpyruvate isomerase N-terminal domain-containing protein [Actinoplanes sp. NPDC051513]|uniref:maleylpyruvate isomerase N-terminal domain-containing protein n=1 Tax=Actinoplanes sp. NPDC051513 TaxID=3363908 RepID=UPI003788C7BB